MLRKVLAILGLVIFSVAIVGCGPEDSVLDEKEAQEREDFQKIRTRLDPVVGIYDGQLQTRDAKDKEIAVQARLIIKHITLLGEGAVITRTASLGGVVIRVADGDGADLYFPDFTKGDYDPSTGAVALVGAGPDIGGHTSYKVEFAGTLLGDELIGELSTPQRKGMKFKGLRQTTR